MPYGYVVISHERPTTFIVGVYSSELRAWTKVVSILKKQVTFAAFAKGAQSHSGFDLQAMSSADIAKEILRPGPNDLSDFIADELLISVEKAKTDTLFDFTPWLYWDEKNLYNAQNMILNREFGPVKPRPFPIDALLYRHE